MRCLSKKIFKLILGGILFLSLLAGCGPGGDGSSSGGGSGGGGDSNGFSGSNTSSAVTVISTQTTDSNGNISVATSNTSEFSVTVNDTSSGTPIPISGLNVNITTDNNKNYYLYLTDPSDEIPPIPIGFNVNDVSSSSTKSISNISVGETLGCGLQGAVAISSYVVSILVEEIKVIANILKGKNILVAIGTAPVAFEGTSNFQQLDDNSLTGIYLGRFNLKDAIKALDFYTNTVKTTLALSTVALTATGVGAPAAVVTKVAGVVVSTQELLAHLESVIYCFYGYNGNDIFDWYFKYGGVLVPVPVDPNSQNPVISSLTANLSTLITNGTTSITCNANDLNNNPLKYYWSVTGGNISGSGPTVNWTAPSSADIYTVSCNVSNGKSISYKNIDIEVIPASTLSSSSSPTINFVTIPSQVLYPGDSFTITYNVTNPGSAIDAILGASIGPSGTSIWPISDSVNDVKISIPSGTSNVSRKFTISSYISPGTYDLLVALWGDSNSNNVIDNSDTLLNSKPNRPAITIGGTGTNTKPESFTLNVTAGCSGSSPENLLSWTASSGATGYYAVYRCTGSSCTPTLFWQNATTVPYTTFRNTSVTAGTPYTYFIRASNTYGYTDSNLATVTTRSDCGSTPNNSPVISSVIPNPNPPVNMGSTVSITCSATDPDGDALTYTWTSTGGNFSGSVSSSVVSWIAPSTANTYTVTCSVSDGKGGSDSQGISISVISSTTVTPPVAPSNLVANAMGQNSITLAWQDNSDNETGFKIERKTGASGSYAQIAQVAAISGYGSGVAYDDIGLTAGTTYCYRVRAYNSVDNLPYSYESCATTQTQQTIRPTATTGTASNTTSNSATLNGTINPNGVPTSALFIWDTKTPPLANLTTPTQYYSGTSNVSITTNLSGLSPKTTYYFRVVALTSTERVYGDPVAFTTTGISTPLERITNGSFSSGTSGWTLVGDFWAGTNLTRYRTSPGYASGGVDSTGSPKSNAPGYMYQTVTIPSGATSATLSFWLNITSDETTTTSQYDRLFVEVLNSSGTVLTTLATYSNLDKGTACGTTCIYSQKSFNLTSYKGQTLRIQFRATTDGATDTVFRIDDVSLMSDGN